MSARGAGALGKGFGIQRAVQRLFDAGLHPLVLMAFPLLSSTSRISATHPLLAATRSNDLMRKEAGKFHHAVCLLPVEMKVTGGRVRVRERPP